VNAFDLEHEVIRTPRLDGAVGGVVDELERHQLVAGELE
jgi:hypothetical protein